MKGKIYVLGDDIDTDQIIPAEYLVYSLTNPEERKMYGHFALSSVPPGQQGLPDGNMPFIEGDAFTSEFAIIIAGKNFGCGSSREHAPFALKEAGCVAVIAESYARIFYRNAVDGGFVFPFESFEPLQNRLKTGDEAEIDVDKGILFINGEEIKLKDLGGATDILRAGDIFAYARQTGMIAAK